MAALYYHIAERDELATFDPPISESGTGVFGILLRIKQTWSKDRPISRSSHMLKHPNHGGLTSSACDRGVFVLNQKIRLSEFADR
jgi:hypothetical protein